jgi:hypothetical protein
MVPGKPLQGRVVLFATKPTVPGIYKALALNAAAAGIHLSFAWIAGGLGPFHDAAMKTLRVGVG